MYANWSLLAILINFYADSIYRTILYVDGDMSNHIT